MRKLLAASRPFSSLPLVGSRSASPPVRLIAFGRLSLAGAGRLKRATASSSKGAKARRDDRQGDSGQQDNRLPPLAAPRCLPLCRVLVCGKVPIMVAAERGAKWSARLGERFSIRLQVSVSHPSTEQRQFSAVAAAADEEGPR